MLGFEQILTRSGDTVLGESYIEFNMVNKGMLWFELGICWKNVLLVIQLIKQEQQSLLGGITTYESLVVAEQMNSIILRLLLVLKERKSLETFYQKVE